MKKFSQEIKEALEQAEKRIMVNVVKRMNELAKDPELKDLMEEEIHKENQKYKKC